MAEIAVRVDRALLVAAARAVLARQREAIISTPAGVTDASAGALADAVLREIARSLAPSLQPVINATGVILHTNLGRAPLSAAALERIRETAGGYTNLEYDLATGTRGRRDVHTANLLMRLTGADAAVVVNNNAAAVFLVLAALARGGDAIVSRGELIEIGESFRIPDIMVESGAVLREVGTTNRTTVADYERVLGERTRLLLRVHRSNFHIVGFTARPLLEELVGLGRRSGVPVYEDLGSGCLADLSGIASGQEGAAGAEAFGATSGSTFGAVAADADSSLVDASLADRALVSPSRLDPSRVDPSLVDSSLLDRGAPEAAVVEPTVRASIAAGVDIVSFSGDKLLGGPQAGIIVGRAPFVARVRKHPLFRALRLDKLAIAALEATLQEYLLRGGETLPVLAMIRVTPAEIAQRAEKLVEALRKSLLAGEVQFEIVDGDSVIGGGSTPNARLRTRLLQVSSTGWSASQIEARLRTRRPGAPVLARIAHNRVVLDLRTVFPQQDGALANALAVALGTDPTTTISTTL